MTDTPATYRAQLVRRPNVGWVLFVVVPGLVSEWPETDFLTIDGHPPTLADRARALESFGYRLATPATAWEWTETQDGAECAPQEGDAPVALSAVAMVVPAASPAGCGACRKPFDPSDTRWDGQNRYHSTDWCRSCVDRCHNSEIADHRCPVCS